MVYNVGFAEYPLNISLLIGSEMEAVFRCRHLSPKADINWRINGDPVQDFHDITTGSTDDNDTSVSTLTIPATTEYNRTEVVCWAFLHGPPPLIENTPAVTLTIIAGWYGNHRDRSLNIYSNAGVLCLTYSGSE